VQNYPDLRAYPGGPPLRPYDVTAHTLPYLLDFEAVAVDEPVRAALSEPIAAPDFAFELPEHLTGNGRSRVAIYKSWQEPMEEGWTRWVFDQHDLQYDTLHDADVRGGRLADRYDAILLQTQSGRSIVEGFRPGSVPPGYEGGIGDAGVQALREFVRAGGRLVAVEDAALFVAELFDLRISNAVDRLPNTEFYVPGSILRLEVEPGSYVAEGVNLESIAWFGTGSMAFTVDDPAIRVLARYGSEDPLLSGWVLGGEHVAGKAALLEADIGRGSVVLFGFQPNYRAQSTATWPLLFNALRR
jgi:hypothetical protein